MADAVYAHQMSKLKHGLPLWVPEPTQSAGVVRIADVGYVHRGTFHRLFNASLPLDHPTHRSMGVPEGFEPLRLGDTDIFTNVKHFDPGPLYTASVTTIETKLELSSGAMQAGAGIHFHCSNKIGAVLLLKDRAVRQDALCIKRLEMYILKHYESWYDFAVERHERAVDIDDLIFVTGCDKTSEWALAAFTEAQRDAGIFFQGGYSPLAGGGLSLVGSWESVRSAETRTGPFRAGSHSPSPSADLSVGRKASTSSLGDSRQNDQCVFVRALKLRVRRVLWPKVIKAGAEPRDEKPGPNDSDKGSPIMNSSTECDLESVPTRVPGYDPLDILLDYIFEVPLASFIIPSSIFNLLDTYYKTNPRIAMVHWDDLLQLSLDRVLPDDLKALLDTFTPDVVVQSDSGVATMSWAPDQPAFYTSPGLRVGGNSDVLGVLEVPRTPIASVSLDYRFPEVQVVDNHIELSTRAPVPDVNEWPLRAT